MTTTERAQRRLMEMIADQGRGSPSAAEHRDRTGPERTGKEVGKTLRTAVGGPGNRRNS